jgi:AcrR family transcriptional regulator
MVMHKKRKNGAGAVSRNADDWQEAALDAFAYGGLRAASIPSIARTLGVTKGSFYWHFGSLDDLIAGALAKWEKDDRETLETLEQLPDPHERLREIFSQSMELRRPQALFVALSGSGVTVVEKALARMSENRLRVLNKAYRDLGFDAPSARERALLVYSAYVGALYLRTQSAVLDSKGKTDSYVRHAIATLIP